jgi:hypothetical protein
MCCGRAAPLLICLPDESLPPLQPSQLPLPVKGLGSRKENLLTSLTRAFYSFLTASPRRSNFSRTLSSNGRAHENHG